MGSRKKERCMSWQPVASYMYPTVNSTDIFTVHFSWIPLGKGREKRKPRHLKKLRCVISKCAVHFFHVGISRVNTAIHGYATTVPVV